LDKITNELDRRFIDNSDIINEISARNLESLKFSIYDTMDFYTKTYLWGIKVLKSELKILHKSMNHYEIKNNLKINEVFLFSYFLD